MEAPSGKGQGLDGTVVPNVDGWMDEWMDQAKLQSQPSTDAQ